MKRLSGNDESEMHRILSREQEILPSSGFTASVMDAVRREAAAPSPIPFPWKRALPGLVLVSCALALLLAAVIVVIAHMEAVSATFRLPTSLPSSWVPIFESQSTLGHAANWTVLALLVTLVSVKLSMRLASGRE